MGFSPARKSSQRYKDRVCSIHCAIIHVPFHVIKRATSALAIDLNPAHTSDVCPDGANAEVRHELRHPVRLTYIKVERFQHPNYLFFDATQAFPNTSEHQIPSTPRSHELIQSHIFECVRIPHEDPHHGIGDEFLRFQAS